MDSRRNFLKKAALMAAGGGMVGGIPAVIQRAWGIDPDPGTTWLDAEHVVILMQENRSFDHCYGTLRGVRGFNDPRAVTLPSGNPVWLQSNRKGETYAPFRLNIRDTKATWMSSLPHSWVDQIDAWQGGFNGGWLDAKRSGNRAYADMPLTLGYYDRRDLPFYYALADAFTVCDQNFCSSLTGTTPNRLHLWTGTIRESASGMVKANVRNEDVDYGREAGWKTFPERLQEVGVSWRIYQNEISLESGLSKEADAWLANFTDNPIEWFHQYRVRYATSHRRFVATEVQELPGRIRELESMPSSPARDKKLAAARSRLEEFRKELETYTDAAYAALTPMERELHDRAFTTNSGDPAYRDLSPLDYKDGETRRRMQVPKGDVLHQFRNDVASGKLPSVSWIVAPENFSDHPGAPWYGAWYLSECLDILTKNPEVWKKTIFVLCYDENDGYFDHVPPFVPPEPGRADKGKVSDGLDPTLEWVRIEQENERAKRNPGAEKRSGPIGLGFRVPLVIASPWSRGGYVNSQVFDHTSILRLLEELFTHRTGKPIRESNITPWRRAVCGDLSSVFRPYRGEKLELPTPVERDPFLGTIHQAQFRELPSGYRRLSAEDIARALNPSGKPEWLPRQEAGTRPACALPYELSAEGMLSDDATTLVVHFAAGTRLFGTRSAGAPFHVLAPGKVRGTEDVGGDWVQGRVWSYAVKAGDAVEGTFPLTDFEGGVYALEVRGPNGFYREMRGASDDSKLTISILTRPHGSQGAGVAVVQIGNNTGLARKVRVRDRSYGASPREIEVRDGGAPMELVFSLDGSGGWYDLEIEVEGLPKFLRRYGGRIESGRETISDPKMGQT